MGNCVSGSDKEKTKDLDMDRSVHGQHYKGSAQKIKLALVRHAKRRGYELYRRFEDALGCLLDLDLDLDLDQDTRKILKEVEPRTQSHIQNLNAFVQVFEHNTSLSSVIFSDRRAGLTALSALFTYFQFMRDSTGLAYTQVFRQSGDVPTRGTSLQDTRSLCPPA